LSKFLFFFAHVLVIVRNTKWCWKHVRRNPNSQVWYAQWGLFQL
jgi:hypothetical protein